MGQLSNLRESLETLAPGGRGPIGGPKPVLLEPLCGAAKGPGRTPTDRPDGIQTVPVRARFNVSNPCRTAYDAGRNWCDAAQGGRELQEPIMERLTVRLAIGPLKATTCRIEATVVCSRLKRPARHLMSVSSRVSPTSRAALVASPAEAASNERTGPAATDGGDRRWGVSRCGSSTRSRSPDSRPTRSNRRTSRLERTFRLRSPSPLSPSPG